VLLILLEISMNSVCFDYSSQAACLAREGVRLLKNWMVLVCIRRRMRVV